MTPRMLNGQTWQRVFSLIWPVRLHRALPESFLWTRGEEGAGNGRLRISLKNYSTLTLNNSVARPCASM